MEYRTLGKTGLSVSVIGFGASPLGDEFRTTTAAERQSAVDAAIDAGINFFDVSPYYGRTLAEQRLGEALGARRSRVVVATKCGRYDVESFDFSAKRITTSIDESLRRLRTDYVDLLQAHDIEFGDYNQIAGETIPALRRIQESGKARFIGITGLPLTMMRRVAENAPVDAFLSYCRYNLLITDLDRLLMPFAQANGIGVINASPLHMGILTERGAPAWHPAPDNVKQAGGRVVELCRRRGVPAGAVALRFCVEHPHIATTLVGLSRPDHVQANVRAIEQPLDPELLREIEAAVGPAANVTWPSGRPENNDYDLGSQAAPGPDTSGGSPGA
ncbi:MAG: aldo/keto reductase [Bryobacteraceae bacterium]|nr:aldo/keto reductase [Bryobacteraceae bacterium]